MRSGREDRLCVAIVSQRLLNRRCGGSACSFFRSAAQCVTTRVYDLPQLGRAVRRRGDELAVVGRPLNRVYLNTQNIQKPIKCQHTCHESSRPRASASRCSVCLHAWMPQAARRTFDARRASATCVVAHDYNTYVRARSSTIHAMQHLRVQHSIATQLMRHATCCRCTVLRTSARIRHHARCSAPARGASRAWMCARPCTRRTL